MERRIITTEATAVSYTHLDVYKRQPEIRTGILKDGKKVTLKEGQIYTLTTREIVGDDTIGHINYSGLNEDVSAGNTILIDDGLIELKVNEVNDTDIVCTVVNGGELGERKGVNVPNVSIKLPALTEKDKEDIRFGIKQGFDSVSYTHLVKAGRYGYGYEFGSRRPSDPRKSCKLFRPLF